MIKREVSKSKEFIDKEEKLLANLRLTNEQELIGDLARLHEERLYCDVTFIVQEVDFPAHLAILYSRAPKFSKHFLPDLLSPSSVQSSISIQNIQPEEFSTFLRSVYAQNDFQDYSKTDYPWAEKVSWNFIDNNKSPFVVNKRNDFEDSLEESTCNVQDQIQYMNANVIDGETVDVEDCVKPSAFSMEAEPSMEACCKIGQDLINLVNDSKSSDITFIVNENERVKAHRISCRAFLIVLYFLYGGITRIPLEIADICDVLKLADMYGLEGLKEVVLCELKLVECHLFHKPCSLCVTGVIECLDVSERFYLAEFKNQCLRWIVKYFDRACSTRCFANLSQQLQDEILSAIQASMNRLNVIDLLYRGDKVESSTPRIKWAEPILVLISSLIDSCLSFIAENFPVIVSEPLFCDMIKGVGWSTPLLEKVFMGVWNNLTIQNCCEQLKVAVRLRNIIAESEDEEEKHFAEEICNLVEKLHTRCQNFIVSNLHRVTHTDGWRQLSPRTQTEIQKSKGGMFVDLGLPSQTNRRFPSSSKSMSNTLRPTSKKRNRTALDNPSKNRTSIREHKPRPTSSAVPGRSQSVTSGKPGTASNKRPVSASSSLRESRPSKPLSGVTDKVKSDQLPGSSKISSGAHSSKVPPRNKSALQKSKGNEAKSNINCAAASKNLKVKNSRPNSMSVASNTSNANAMRKASQKRQAIASRSDSNLSQSKTVNDNKLRRSYPDISQPKLPNEKVKKKASSLDPTVNKGNKDAKTTMPGNSRKQNISDANKSKRFSASTKTTCKNESKKKGTTITLNVNKRGKASNAELLPAAPSNDSMQSVTESALQHHEDAGILESESTAHREGFETQVDTVKAIKVTAKEIKNNNDPEAGKPSCPSVPEPHADTASSTKTDTLTIEKEPESKELNLTNQRNEDTIEIVQPFCSLVQEIATLSTESQESTLQRNEDTVEIVQPFCSLVQEIATRSTESQESTLAEQRNEDTIEIVQPSCSSAQEIATLSTESQESTLAEQRNEDTIEIVQPSCSSAQEIATLSTESQESTLAEQRNEDTIEIVQPSCSSAQEIGTLSTESQESTLQRNEDTVEIVQPSCSSAQEIATLLKCS